MAFNDGLNGVFFNDVLLWWFNGYIHGCSLRESNVAMDNSPLIAKKNLHCEMISEPALLDYQRPMHKDNT